MKMDENLKDAVETIDVYFRNAPSGDARDWQTIRARLVELEAENERLQAKIIASEATLARCEQTLHTTSECWALDAKKMASAEALLRESLSMLNFLLLTELSNSQKKDLRRVVAQITAHLSENGHG